MKKLLLVLSILSLSYVSYSQDQKPSFFDEVYFSNYRSLVSDDNTEDRNGFGIGVNKIFYKDRKFNIIAGLEYNRMSQFKKEVANDDFTLSHQVTYHFNQLTVPLKMRYNFGKKNQFFIDAGLFADLPISGTQQGFQNFYRPDQEGYDPSENIWFNDRTATNLNDLFGATAGFGVALPFKKFDLVLRTDIKQGINLLDSYNSSIQNRYVSFSIGIRF